MMRLHSMIGLLAVLFCWVGPARAEPVTIVCGLAPESLELCRSGSEAWAKARGQEVRVLAYPDSTTRSRDLTGDLLQAGVTDLDVLELDIVWSGLLAPYLVDLAPALVDQRSQFVPVAVDGFTVDGQLVAVPWTLSLGRLFYRTDLLARYGVGVPGTWDELAAAARAVQDGERAAGRNELWGFVWQGRAGEGLTANALEWIVSHGAPGILAPDGSVVVDDPRSGAALAQVASWIETISPGQVLDMGGGESQAAFANGNAAFLRSWSNLLPRLQVTEGPARGNVAMAELPAGSGADGRRASVLGGFGLAVARGSKQQDLALDLVRWLTSATEQRRRALEGDADPSLQELYADPELVAQRPYYPDLLPAFATVVVRPATTGRGAYDAVSRTFAAAVHRILAREVEPAAGLAQLAAQLRRLGPIQRWGS